MFFVPFVGQKNIQKDIYESLISLDKKLRWVDPEDEEFKPLWEEREELFEWRSWVMENMGWYAFNTKLMKEERDLYEWYG